VGEPGRHHLIQVTKGNIAKNKHLSPPKTQLNLGWKASENPTEGKSTKYLTRALQSSQNNEKEEKMKRLPQSCP
jgi:Tfp pilus assembly protein PilF